MLKTQRIKALKDNTGTSSINFPNEFIYEQFRVLRDLK